MLDIRQYKPSDHELVWELHNIALKAAGAHGGIGPWDDDLHDIDATYLGDRGEFLVGECDSRIVAMGALRRSTSDRADIRRMRVHPDFQRRGFGQLILTALERRATDLDYKALHLDTTEQQIAAQRLYEKNGYVPCGIETVRNVTSLLYQKSLLVGLPVGSNCRRYGPPPYRAAAVHGGPGASGEMAPVARQLALTLSLIEPIQTATSLDGQVEELRSVLEAQCTVPVTLIGHSWGAWLSWIVAARHPSLVQKLILIGSPPFEQAYVHSIEKTRLSRLDEEQQHEWQRTVSDLSKHWTQLSALSDRTDSYDPMSVKEQSDALPVQENMFRDVWPSAAELRRSGELLRLARQIRCPVAAIHGNYDPHPAEGVLEPLSKTLSNFRFILLDECGHTPWRERRAAASFYEVLQAALLTSAPAEHTQPTEPDPEPGRLP